MNITLRDHQHDPLSKLPILLSVILFSLFVVSTSCRAQTKPLTSTAIVGRRDIILGLSIPNYR